MRKLIFTVAIAAVSASAVTAMPGGGFGKRDANGNGRIARAEMMAGVEARFARFDANKDGFVTREEMAARHEAKRDGGKRGEHRDHGERRREDRGDRFAKRDGNGDGRLSLAEFQAQAAQRFERLDANRDGAITQDEMAKAREAWKAKRQG